MTKTKSLLARCSRNILGTTGKPSDNRPNRTEQTGTERIRPICGVRAVRSIPAFARIPTGAGAGGAKWEKSNFVTFVVAGDGFSQTSYLIQKRWQPHWSLLLFEERLKLWTLSSSLSLSLFGLIIR